MSTERRPIDDYALASFIVGKVPGKVREQILESLVGDDDTRHLLAVVYEALAAARGPDEAMRFIADRWKRAA